MYWGDYVSDFHVSLRWVSEGLAEVITLVKKVEASAEVV